MKININLKLLFKWHNIYSVLGNILIDFFIHDFVIFSKDRKFFRYKNIILIVNNNYISHKIFIK